MFIGYVCVYIYKTHEYVWNSLAQLVAPGRASLVYKYKTEVKLSVAHGQYDLQNEITADVNIENLGDCNYAVQVKIYKCSILM
jgi:hypothetical protein